MINLLLGKPVSDNIDIEIIESIKELKNTGVFPRIAIVRIGENSGDVFYEKAAMKKADKLGIACESIVLEKDVKQYELIGIIEKLNTDENINGVLLLRPFPNEIDDDLIRNKLKSEKDIDGITDSSLTGILTVTNKGFSPCTAKACMEILDYYGYIIEGQNITIIGRSLVIGKPLSLMMTNSNANVTVCHSRTKEEDLINYCKNSDIVVLATGKTESFGSKFFKEDTVIIDVGTGLGKNGNMAGDIDFEEVDKSGINIYATPVPRGVGSVTTTVLMKNLIEATKNPE
ncbi:MAG TPA: bifunctional 5,10-methylenetetrahydrofolate dehydrogenase/5,10-methenyltetrahydrofolate cyclohydrolase [Anaerovoracaceae bacterium]|nr:bifunctional 5,10-methylenetetrahydrofolate dehydrogenase/5,10-methenyltetrahydrofolate cyclohydrolase [Anaerovoracaceae bacterium]